MISLQKKKNISIFLKPNIQILQSSYTCHITTIHLFPASLQGQSAVYVCTFFVILVIIGSLFLADGSLKQHHMTSKYFINGSQNKSVYSSPLPPFFFKTQLLFVFRLSQSRTWYHQVTLRCLFWCFLSFCSALVYLSEYLMVPHALCWVAASISYECTKHLTSRYWKIVSR